MSSKLITKITEEKIFALLSKKRKGKDFFYQMRRIKIGDNFNQTGEFEIVTVAENESEAFVRYKNILNGEKIQNAEHFIFDTGEKIKSVTVFFGRP